MPKATKGIFDIMKKAIADYSWVGSVFGVLFGVYHLKSSYVYNSDRNLDLAKQEEALKKEEELKKNVELNILPNIKEDDIKRVSRDYNIIDVTPEMASKIICQEEFDRMNRERVFKQEQLDLVLTKQRNKFLKVLDKKSKEDL